MCITLKEVLDNNLLKDDILEALPNEGKCTCGEEIVFTDSLSQIYCPSEYCYIKLGLRVFELAKYFGATDWDIETSIEVCRTFKLKTPFQVYILEDRECETVNNFNDKVNNLVALSKKKLYIWEIVKLLGVESLDKVAYKLFSSYNNMEEAFDDIEMYQVPLIADRLGLKSANTGVLAVSIYNCLLKYKNELYFGEKKLEVLEYDEPDLIKIAVDGNVRGFNNKSEFINFLNLRYKGKIVFRLMNSVVGGLDVIVVDGDRTSRKVRLVEKYNSTQDSTDKNIRVTGSSELVERIDMSLSEE